MAAIAADLRDWPDQEGCRQRLQDVLFKSCLAEFIVGESKTSFQNLVEKPRYYREFFAVIDALLFRAKNCSECARFVEQVAKSANFSDVAHQATLFTNALRK